MGQGWQQPADDYTMEESFSAFLSPVRAGRRDTTGSSSRELSWPWTCWVLVH